MSARLLLAVLLAAALSAPGMGAPLAAGAQRPPDLEALRKEMTRLINRDRAAKGLLPVELDAVACAAAQAHTDDMAQNTYFSHMSPDGGTPFQRYARAGGLDHVQENIFFNSWSGGPVDVYAKLSMAEAQKALMRSPGHKKNILTAYHTHVGVGVAVNLKTQSIYVAQEFVDRYVDMRPLPETFRQGDTIRFKGRMIYMDHGPYFFALSHSKYPNPAPGGKPVMSGPYLDGGEKKILTHGPWNFKYDDENRMV